MIARHDVLVLFDVINGNPNGDPDAGNMPRIDPNSNKGLVSDVCLKRKIRNYIALKHPARVSANTNGFDLFIRQGTVLETTIEANVQAAIATLPKNASEDQQAEAAIKRLCCEFYDIRTFGAVLSTGKTVLRGSAYGQIQGPVQITFGQSFHPVIPQEHTITRCAVTAAKDTEKERTMGHKFTIGYALYAAKCFISPPFADRTGFDQTDLDLFFEALLEMFTHDHSAARSEMSVRRVFDFEHVGTQDRNNAEQNRQEARLGCCHAHRLFDGIHVQLKNDKAPPECYNDYDISFDWNPDTLPPGIKLYLRR